MITFNQKILRQALTGLRVLKVGKQKVSPLHCVLIRGIDETISFEATTLDEHLCFEGPGLCDTPGAQLVPYDLLQDVNRSADPDSAISINPGVDLTYTTGGARVAIPLSEPDVSEFPPAPVATGPHTVLPSGILGSIVEAQGCASTDANRHLLNSVLVTPHEVVATDGRQLYRRNGLELAVPTDGAIFPVSGVPGILDPGAPAELWTWDLQETPKAMLAQGAWRWITKLVVGNYPNFRQAIPRLDDYGTTVSIGESDAARIASVLPMLPGFREPNHPVVLTITETGATLSPPARLPQVRVALDRSAVTGPAGTVQFNAGFLLAALKRGFRELRVRDHVSPLVMTDASRVNLWMPIQLESDAPPPSAPATPPVAEQEPSTKENNMVAAANRDTAESTAPAVPSPGEPVDATQHVQRARELLRELNGTLGQLLTSLRETTRQHRAVERDYETLKRNLRVLKAVEA